MSRSELMSPAGVRRTVTRLAYEVRERNRGADTLMVFGLKSRGRALAEMLAAALEEVEGHEVPVHALTLAGYRDDEEAAPLILTEENHSAAQLTALDDGSAVLEDASDAEGSTAPAAGCYAVPDNSESQSTAMRGLSKA